MIVLCYIFAIHGALSRQYEFIFMPDPTIHRNITLKRLVLDAIQFFRRQRLTVKYLGKPFSISRKFVVIDITYRCNLACSNCNRSCTKAPTNQEMTPNQIADFIDQSIAENRSWQRIRLLGGEPTFHPDFLHIVEMLRKYRRNHCPELRLVVCTNGAGNRVRRILKAAPRDVVIKNTFKSSRQRLFRPFNMAPVDSPFFRFSDFACGCRILNDCGIGVTPQGIYACAVSGGIDRVVGYGLGRKHLPLSTDDMTDQLRVFCPLCGHFGFRWPTRVAKRSPTWERIYRITG